MKETVTSNVSRSRNAADIAALEQQSVPGMGYSALMSYVGFFHNNVYYRNYEVIDAENIPQDCPLMIVCDHQNNLFDVLGLLFSAGSRAERKIRIVARGGIFENPKAAKFLRWLGLLPAYRLSMDGEEALKGNESMFWEAEEELLRNGTVMIFPEANEVPKHRLRDFSQGYLHILFQAAEAADFEKEIFVIPACNHYSEYDSVQSDMLVRYGTPISLAPYYDLYKSKPRTAKRQVNALVREQMSGLMLDIREDEFYDSIDFIRNTYGVGFAAANGCNPNSLSNKLEADKLLCGKLAEAKNADPDLIDGIYREAAELRDKYEKAGMDGNGLPGRPSVAGLIGRGLLLLAGLPLFLISLIPSLLILLTPEVIGKKVKDPVLRRPACLIVNMLIVIPASFLVTMLAIWIIRGSLLLGLAAAGLSPFLCVIGWYYHKWSKNWLNDIKLHRMRRKGELDDIARSTRALYDKLNSAIDQKIAPGI